MNIVVDFGNTIAKVGIFKDEVLTQTLFFREAPALKDYLLRATDTQNIIVSSVSTPSDEILSWAAAPGEKLSVSVTIPTPVKILYATPLTLGVDRLAAVCGAFSMFPDRNCLVIDAGTCMTFEFLDKDRNYHGGAISPGVRMRFEAMHHFTARLPLVQAVETPGLIGISTETSLQSGVINGMRAEVRGIVQEYQERFSDLIVLLCGGDAAYLDDPGIDLIHAPDIVLNGLHLMLTYSLRTHPLAGDRK